MTSLDGRTHALSHTDGLNTRAETPIGRGTLQDASSDKTTAASASSTATTSSQSNSWLSGTTSWISKVPATKRRRDDSPTMFLTKRKSSKGDAIPASTTKVHVSSDGLVDETSQINLEETHEEAEQSSKHILAEPPLPPEPPVLQETPTSKWLWRSWWSRLDGYSELYKANIEAQETLEEAQKIQLPSTTSSEDPYAETTHFRHGSSAASKGQVLDRMDASQGVLAKQDSSEVVAPTSTDIAHMETVSSSSWFRLWSNAQNSGATTMGAKSQRDDKPAMMLDRSSELADLPVKIPASQESESLLDACNETTSSTSSTSASAKPSAWAFWYRGKSDNETDVAERKAQKHVGEVAVFDTPSQSHPEIVHMNKQKQSHAPIFSGAQTSSNQEVSAKRSFKSLKVRPNTQNLLKQESTVALSSNDIDKPIVFSPKPSSTKQSATQLAPKQAAKVKQDSPNIILPEFKATYRLAQQPSFWKQVRQYFLGSEPASPHLHINPAPPRIKKAVAIGIHGFFPAPIIQKVLGQPTGTSIRFANAAAAAIKSWSATRGYEPDIEQIALEGEGFIAERVTSLWKLLLNWIEHIKAADFILFACHSQGVPVTMILIAKLIQFGCVHAARIGVCAMAGVNMGPFIEYKTKYFGPTAAELFEFSNPKSLVSQMYLASLDEVLRFGVRIVYVGSIDDQLVSLESSTFSTLTHPYIYRAVFVDGRIHAPDFLTHLVGFTLKLRNLGLPDHGLIRELSPALAGSLYGGEGHSRVYEDPAVYLLAVQHALETTSLPILPQQRPSTSGSFQGIKIPVVGEKVDAKDVYKLRVKKYQSSASSTNPNPFFLPWAMRGLLEEEFVRKELGEEVEELLAMFETWNPTGKQLKDVKFRLEGVRQCARSNMSVL